MSSNFETAIINRNKKALEDLREEIMKAEVNKKPVKITPYMTIKKLPNTLLQSLKELKIVEEYDVEGMNRRGGSFLKWIFKSKDNENGEITTKVVTNLMQKDREIVAKRKLTNIQMKSKSTTAVVKRERWDPETVKAQIKWLTDKITTNALTPNHDYLRPGELEMYTNISENLAAMVELTETLPVVLKGLTEFNSKLNPPK